MRLTCACSTGAPSATRGAPLRFGSGSVSRRGIDREQNCDMVLEEVDHHLFAVADGVGGSDWAAMASKAAITSIQQLLVPAMPRLLCGGAESALQSAFEEANSLLLQKGRALGHHIQTTLTTVIFMGNKMYVGHTGDTRCYLLAQGAVRVLTTDHTIVGDLVRESLMSEEKSWHHPRRGMLSGCLGMHKHLRFQSLSIEVETGQSVVLCSDGISGFLSHEDIIESSQNHGDAASLAEGLAGRALTNGSRDDISAVVIMLR